MDCEKSMTVASDFSEWETREVDSERGPPLDHWASITGNPSSGYAATFTIGLAA
jgi:hypothetical protein